MRDVRWQGGHRTTLTCGVVLRSCWGMCLPATRSHLGVRGVGYGGVWNAELLCAPLQKEQADAYQLFLKAASFSLDAQPMSGHYL